MQYRPILMVWHHPRLFWHRDLSWKWQVHSLHNPFFRWFQFLKVVPNFLIWDNFYDFNDNFQSHKIKKWVISFQFLIRNLTRRFLHHRKIFRNLRVHYNIQLFLSWILWWYSPLTDRKDRLKWKRWSREFQSVLGAKYLKIIF